MQQALLAAEVKTRKVEVQIKQAEHNNKPDRGAEDAINPRDPHGPPVIYLDILLLSLPNPPS
jgi:hypothetical protein